MVSTISQSIHQDRRSALKRLQNSPTVSRNERKHNLWGETSCLTEIENSFLEITSELLQAELNKKEQVDLVAAMLNKENEGT